MPSNWCHQCLDVEFVSVYIGWKATDGDWGVCWSSVSSLFETKHSQISVHRTVDRLYCYFFCLKLLWWFWIVAESDGQIASVVSSGKLGISLTRCQKVSTPNPGTRSFDANHDGRLFLKWHLLTSDVVLYRTIQRWSKDDWNSVKNVRKLTFVSFVLEIPGSHVPPNQFIERQLDQKV